MFEFVVVLLGVLKLVSFKKIIILILITIFI